MAQPADDWVVPGQPAPPSGADDGADDWVTPARRPAELRAYHPTWRDRLAGMLMPDERPSAMRSRVVRALVGSEGVGNTGGISAADLFPPTGVALAGNEAVRAADEGRPVSAALHAIGVIPAPGVGPIARTVTRTATTGAQELANAADSLGVRLPRAAVGDSRAADIAKEVPTIVQNPIRSAADRALTDIDQAVAQVQARASGQQGDQPLRAARQGLDDWIGGRSNSADEAVQEATTLRANLGPQSNVPDSVLSAFPDMRPADSGLLALNGFSNEERQALRVAGLIERGKLPDGTSHEGVNPERLWELRKARRIEMRGQAGTQSGPMEIVTPDQNMTVRATPELVELSDLSLASGRLQPRDRGRAEYGQEAHERAQRLDPLQLQPSRVADSGAPIVLPDGTILSGNGRVLSISEVYANPALAERAAAYRASLGPEAANMRQPVLIMRTDALGTDDAARFADLANRGRIAAMSATERAARDSKALGADGIALYRGGDFEAPQNAAFLRAFMENAVTAAERPSVSSGGRLTQEGAARMRAAVLHGAYGDSVLLARMLESTDDNIRNITNALIDAAPGFAQMRAEIRAGNVMADLDITPQISEAVRRIADLRSRGISPAEHFAQADAFHQTDPLVEAWIRAFYNSELSRPISRQKMAEVLNAYSTEARKHAPGGLIADPTTAGDVLNVASRARGQGTEAENLLSGIPAPVGQGVRDSGAAARGQEPAGLGSGVAEGGAREAGDAGATAARVAGQGQAGQPVISAEQAQQIITRNLSAARQDSLAQALSLERNSLSPERVASRVAEMARSRKPADVSGLLDARRLMGDEVWADTVGPQVLHRLGQTKAGWDVREFAKAWEGMTNTAKDALFKSNKRRGLRQALDDLATLGGRVDRLKDLSRGELEELAGKIPLFGGLTRWGISGWKGQILTHLGLTVGTGGAHLPLGLAGQGVGAVVAKILSRPVAAQKTVRWVQSFERLIDQAATQKGANAATLRRETTLHLLATRALAAELANEFGGDPAALEKRLLGQGQPMMRLGGPREEPTAYGGDDGLTPIYEPEDEPEIPAPGPRSPMHRVDQLAVTEGGPGQPGPFRNLVGGVGPRSGSAALPVFSRGDIDLTSPAGIRSGVTTGMSDPAYPLEQGVSRVRGPGETIAGFSRPVSLPEKSQERVPADDRMSLGGPVPTDEASPAPAQQAFTPLGRLEQHDFGNGYTDASGEFRLINPQTDVVGRDGMVYARNDAPLNPEAHRAAAGVGLFGKALDAIGVPDYSGDRARTSWREAAANTFGGVSMANAIQGGVNAADRLMTEEPAGLQRGRGADEGAAVAGTLAMTNAPGALAAGPQPGTLFVFAGSAAANRLARKGWPQPKAALALAEQLEAKGASRETIYRDTSKILKDTPFAGVSKTSDGQWRFEISDEGLVAHPNPPPGQGLRFPQAGNADAYLGLVEHPILKTAYPEMEGLVATIDPNSYRGGSMGMVFIENNGKLEGAPMLTARGENPWEARSVVAHELDHFAQAEEGFPGGGDPRLIAPRDEERRAVSPGYHWQTNQRSVGPRQGEPPESRRYAGQVVTPAPPEVMSQRIPQKIFEDLVASTRRQLNPDVPEERARRYATRQTMTNTLGDEGSRAIRIYERLGGEESARETESRLRMTAAQRRKTPPDLHSDKLDRRIIARIGQSHPDATGHRMMPDRDTILGMPETRAIADRLYKQLSKSMKGKTDAEIWEAAYSSAAAEVQRRIEGVSWAKFRKLRKIDRNVGNRELLARRIARQGRNR